jgi:hypothetical protein
MTLRRNNGLDGRSRAITSEDGEDPMLVSHMGGAVDNASGVAEAEGPAALVAAAAQVDWISSPHLRSGARCQLRCVALVL